MTRSASSSLRGYSYQFHESIIRLLDTSNDDDFIVLEGIEDIDLENECVQVKYLASKKLIPSSIKKPVTLMLQDYIDNSPLRQGTKYKLYAHFGDPSGNTDFLDTSGFYHDCANALTEDKNNNIKEIDKKILDIFRGKFTLEIGMEFEEQEKSVQQKLTHALGVLAEETSMYFYQNAIHLVLSLSIKNDENDRKISKQQFLSSINQKKHLFGIWKKLEIGKNTFFSEIKKSLNDRDFHGNRERLIFIDTACLRQDPTGYGESQLIIDLIEKHSLVDKNTSTKPLTIVIDAPENNIVNLKCFLIDEGKEFNDGYEQINFSANAFNRLPIVNTTGKIARKTNVTSYEIRLVCLSTYLGKIEDLKKPQTAVYFSQKIPFDLKGVVQYHIPAIETYREIKGILS